jgi:hypothetical protein
VRQEDCKLEAILGYLTRPRLKSKKKKKDWCGGAQDAGGGQGVPDPVSQEGFLEPEAFSLTPISHLDHKQEALRVTTLRIPKADREAALRKGKVNGCTLPFQIRARRTEVQGDTKDRARPGFKVARMVRGLEFNSPYRQKKKKKR